MTALVKFCKMLTSLSAPSPSLTPAALDVPSSEQNKMAASKTKGGGRVIKGGMEERGDARASAELQSSCALIDRMKIKVYMCHPVQTR